MQAHNTSVTTVPNLTPAKQQSESAQRQSGQPSLVLACGLRIKPSPFNHRVSETSIDWAAPAGSNTP